MAIEMLQLPVTTVASNVAIIMPNSLIQLSVPTGSPAVYVGLSNTVSTTNGFAVNAGVPHTFTVPNTSQGANLWAVVASTSSILSILITTSA